MRPTLWIPPVVAGVLAASGLPACGTMTRCYFDCVGAPPGCHVEGAVDSTECGKASCGTIVCPEAGSDAGADASFDAATEAPE